MRITYTLLLPQTFQWQITLSNYPNYMYINVLYINIYIYIYIYIYTTDFLIIFLTINPNPLCGRNPEKTHDFRQSVDKLFPRAIRCSIQGLNPWPQ